jgi:uncharacterized protein (TIGR03067 family)
MTMRLAVTLLIPLSALAPGPGQPAGDAKKLEGTWAVVWREYDGQKSEDVNDLLTGQEYTVAIKGGVFKVTRDVYLVEGPLTLKVDGTQKPKAVDFADQKGRLVYQGIYKIKGDQLTLCYGPTGRRPERFVSKKDSQARLLVLKRPSAFWDQMEPGKLRARLEPLLNPHISARSGPMPGEPYTITKHLVFEGVGQSPQRMSEVLGRLRDELLESVKAAGAEVRGDIRDTKENALLTRFEFDYRQGKTDGRVRGEIKPALKEGCWDLECLLGELLVHTRSSSRHKATDRPGDRSRDRQANNGVTLPWTLDRGPYQSGPSGWPSRGSQARAQVSSLIEPLTKRTLPSASTTLMPPAWGDCARLESQP